jgi:putative mRNA 3-end processing factor
MNRHSLIRTTAKGLYCEKGNFYIDPWKPVDRAVLTHAHSDHAYPGNRTYLVPEAGALLSRIRLGDDAAISTLPYGEPKKFNDVTVSFHPAGHVLGSAQIRVEYEGEVWVVSGDFKLTADPTCLPFESIPCDKFITEATFGLPIYRWPTPETLFNEINDWWRRNREDGKASVIFAYALGKAQRILSGIDPSIGEVFTHGAVERLVRAYRDSGVVLPDTIYAGSVSDKKRYPGSLIVAPPSAAGSAWLKRFGRHSTAFASGWMMVRGARRRRAVDRGFVLSDHADWPELNQAIRATGAETVYVTHGFSDELVRWLNETGMNAKPLKTEYHGESDLLGEVLKDEFIEENLDVG